MSVFKYFTKTEPMLGSIVSEGLLPERSVGVKETPERVVHAWQMRTMTDKGRLLTDGTNYAR